MTPLKKRGTFFYVKTPAVHFIPPLIASFSALFLAQRLTFVVTRLPWKQVVSCSSPGSSNINYDHSNLSKQPFILAGYVWGGFM